MANKIAPQAMLPVAQGGQGNGTAYSLQLTSTGTSVNSVLPTNGAGGRPSQVYIQAYGNGYLRLSIGASAATVNDLGLSANNPVVLPVGAFTHVNWISDTGTVKCNVTALETA